MLVSYIELDSTYRNRDQYPIQSKFDALIYTCENDDPISLSTPIVEWNGNNVTINGTVVYSTPTTIVFTAVGLEQEQNYYSNAILSPPGVRIVSYKYLGSNTAEVEVENMQTALATGTLINIFDPTDLATLRIFVPKTTFDPYTGKLLYDETVNSYATITSFDQNTGTVTVDSPIAGWNVSDSFSIRSEPPIILGTTGVTSTQSDVFTGISSGIQSGMFMRLRPSYPSVAPAGEIRQIVAYNPSTTVVKVFPPFSVPPISIQFEIMRWNGSNHKPLIYCGQLDNDMSNNTVRLLNVMVPNQIMSTGQRPTDLPYIYVSLTPKSSILYRTITSNSPVSNTMLFRATLDNTYSDEHQFVKFTGDDMAVRVQFKHNTNFSFEVKLPNGEFLDYQQKDTSSPAIPNPILQISALFEIKRGID